MKMNTLESFIDKLDQDWSLYDMMDDNTYDCVIIDMKRSALYLRNNYGVHMEDLDEAFGEKYTIASEERILSRY